MPNSARFYKFAAMKSFTNSSHLSNGQVFVPVLQKYVKTWIVVLCFGIVGFVTPTIQGYFWGFPVAHVQDELSYTVAADTYASGRLTNPTPAFFESFETPHVLMEPSYISKYPPLQGMFMAAGQVVFGNQIFGVWLSCGLMAASLFWMLLAWTRSNWAFVGTVLMILFLGIDSYWAQSFWGGMVAASGGAIFFGGFRRLFDKLSVGSTVLMTLGGVIIVNSRPFEGTISMLPPLMFLLVWLLRDKSNQLSRKFSQVVLPGIIVAAIGLSAMFYQYYRVTGNPFKLPYSVHHAQYYPTPLFIFQPVNKSATKGNARIRRMYEAYTSPPILENLLKIEGLPDSLYLSPVYGIIYLIIAIPVFFFSPFLTILLFCSLPLLIRRSKWLLLITVTILFTFACMCLGIWWDQYHYAASLTSCFFLLLVEGLRQFYAPSKKGKERRMIFGTLIFLVVGSFLFLQFYSYQQPYMEEDYSADKALLFERLSAGEPVEIKVPTRATFFKADLEEMVEKLPDRYIALVNYNPNYSFHDEIVFNKADIENAKLIWAHDLGSTKNKPMLRFYNNRKILMISVEGTKIKINPLPSN